MTVRLAGPDLDWPALTALVLFAAACSGAAKGHGPTARPAAPAAPPPLARATQENDPRAANATKAPAPKAPDAVAPPPLATIVDSRPRIGSLGHFSYIYSRPEAAGLPLGYIRMGTSVPLRSPKPIEGKRCGRGFYAVEPRGYVCLDPLTTLDLHDPYYLALASVAPTDDAVWFYGYAFSNGAPMYSRIPTRKEIEKEDAKFGPRGSFVQLAEWSRGHEELIVDEPFAATDPIPDFLAGGKRHVGSGLRDPKKLVWRVIPNGSMVAYAKAFEADGRVYLLTPDLMVVPADRVRKMRRSTFHGVKLENGLELPIAWNRTKDPKPFYRRGPSGLVAEQDALAAKSPIVIEDASVVIDGRTYFPLRGRGGSFVLAEDVTVSRARKTLPKGVEEGQKWIEAKIVQGTLTAYEGLKPVMATLFSPGKGGVPVPGLDNTKYSTTSVGIFPIEWKDHIATMSPDKKSEPTTLWFTDVPHIQYLRPPLAMHVAFWHEDFGNPKSAECVNISPEDGRFLFQWTEPALPEGWGGIRPGGGNGKSTPVIITAR